MPNETHKLLITLTTMFNIFTRLLYSTMAIFYTHTLCVANIMMYVPFISPYFVTRLSARIADNLAQESSPKRPT